MDKYWRKYYEMEELNFLSENITIEIRPLIKTIDDSSLSLLSSTIEAFKPMKKSKVPLWVAVKLKQINKVNIETPYYYDKTFLEEIIKNEKNSKDLTSIPYYFFETLNILSHKAPDAIQDIDVVKTLASDLVSVRSEKINLIIKDIKEYEYYFKINNITSKELEILRMLVEEILNLKSDMNRNN